MDQHVSGVVLCGGQGRRFGGSEKPLAPIHGRPLIAHVLDRLGNQVDELLISANGNIELYENFGPKVLRDQNPGRGPLEGILAATREAAGDLVFVCPGDCPFLAEGLVAALGTELREGTDAVVAHDGVRQQNLFMLLRRACSGSIAGYLDAGERSAHGWIERTAAAVVRFGNPADYRNVNTVAELAALESGCSGRPFSSAEE